MKGKIDQVSSDDTKFTEKMKQFALGRLASYGLKKSVDSFFFGVIRKEKEPFCHAVFANRSGEFISVINILVIDNTPICHMCIQVSLKGKNYVLPAQD